MLASAQMDRSGRPGRLMRGYLHKTSNNLCGIKGYASLIVAGADEQRTTTWARRILAEVAQMEAVQRSVQDLAFPRPSSAPDGTLDAAVGASVAEARRVHPRLVAKVCLGATGALLLPARDLQLVLGELLANAAEAAASARVAITTVAPRDGRVALLLADSGPGLPREILPEAAEPFVTTKAGHLGIGLARVDTIMQMHGLAWSLANADEGGAVACLEVASAPGAARRAASGAQKGSHV